MRLNFASVCAVACTIGLAACSKSPASPSATPGTATDAAQAASYPDGSTLKITAPTPVSPANGQRLEFADSIALTIQNGELKFASNVIIGYEFQVMNAGGVIVAAASNVPAGNGTTTWALTSQLDGDQTYSWRARATTGDGSVGPWSPTWTFVAPQNAGFNRPGALYDPLVNGQTLGQIVGPAQWIPGVGLRLLSQLSHVVYVLPATIREGEFSLIVTGMEKNTDGDKTKLFSMAQGFDDIVTNDRRMTVEKRGDPAGVIAWRFITHDDQIDTEGPERREVDFFPDRDYFWQATWRNNFFRVLVREGGVDGRTIYDMGKHFDGAQYDPTPHVAYLGAPVGRSGEAGASVDNVTYRQIWLSSSPRPAYANK